MVDLLASVGHMQGWQRFPLYSPLLLTSFTTTVDLCEYQTPSRSRLLLLALVGSDVSGPEMFVLPSW